MKLTGPAFIVTVLIPEVIVEEPLAVTTDSVTVVIPEAKVVVMVPLESVIVI
jgi:hypothetical protein